jgi:hypothetical protein
MVIDDTPSQAMRRDTFATARIELLGDKVDWECGTHLHGTISLQVKDER